MDSLGIRAGDRAAYGDQGCASRAGSVAAVSVAPSGRSAGRCCLRRQPRARRLSISSPLMQPVGLLDHPRQGRARDRSGCHEVGQPRRRTALRTSASAADFETPIAGGGGYVALGQPYSLRGRIPARRRIDQHQAANDQAVLLRPAVSQLGIVTSRPSTPRKPGHSTINLAAMEADPLPRGSAPTAARRSPSRPWSALSLDIRLHHRQPINLGPCRRH